MLKISAGTQKYFILITEFEGILFIQKLVFGNEYIDYTWSHNHRWQTESSYFPELQTLLFTLFIPTPEFKAETKTLQ